ncbi:MAG: thiosulfate sulfurtransferase [Candidatus Syntrophonatronum acetioxidans]|uniref:thiosulfate sulfurtransferase n=1 Tax=Candidatus Syntrophonatronum acetioxidans TaxID=1795816 RepID=A0A424YBK0_9FIRM|nr:MAG: thiosulfate sulfurtransferase [Candidatus Syntrophonatronum acetioxidans]
MDKLKYISTEELMKNLNNNQIKIIDVRSVEAYNGWKLKGECRGGHIRGAKSLPIKWLNYIDWLEIVRSKDIFPDHTLVIYSYNHSDSQKVARHFIKAGYHKVKLYNDFLDEWIVNPEFPMEYLPRYRHLVSADWLNELIITGKAPEYDNDKFSICHAHYRNREDYIKGHIPGAISLDTNTLESTETWNRRSPEELKLTLEKLGITCNTTVILYGRYSFPNNNSPYPGSSAGHLGAIRCAVIMIYAGVKDVRILNGGLQSWRDAKYQITSEGTEVKPADDFGIEIPAHQEIMVDTPEAKKILKAKDQNLVCVRSWPEYMGKVSGYNYIEKRGRIPGSVFSNSGTDAYHMENFRNLDFTTREYHEIEKFWLETGITPDKRNAFYCGTGWRGSEAFLNAWLMGWPDIAVYDGGWFEWSNDEANPYEIDVE